jgi:hypothetical protein
MSAAVSADAEPLNIFEHDGPLRPGDVTLLFTGTMSPKNVLAGWLRLIAFPAHRRSLNPIVVVGLHPDIAGPRNLRSILAEIRTNEHEPWIDPHLLEASTEDAESLLGELPFAEQEAVIALGDMERFRFGELRNGGTFVETVDGTSAQHSEKDDLNLPHIAQLCRMICAEAVKSGQKWLLLARGFGFGDNVPSDLSALKNLSVSQISPDETGSDPSIEFRAQLRAVPASGPSAALRWVDEKLPPGKIATIARANILSVAGQPVQAFREAQMARDKVLQDGLNYEILQLAQFAAAAGERAEAVKYLAALPSLSAAQFETLRSAWILADKLGVAAVVLACRSELRRRFPKHRFTQTELYYERLEAGDYPAAIAIATALSDGYRLALATFFQTEKFDPEPLLAAARPVGEESVALWHVARTAESRRLFPEARAYAARLANDSDYGGKAIALRIRILVAQMPGFGVEAYSQELSELVRWYADHPGQLEARFALEGVYESVTTQFESIACSVFVLGEELERLGKTYDLKNAQAESLIETERDGIDHDLISAVMEETIRLGAARQLVIGLGEVVPSLKGKVTPEVMSDLGTYLRHAADNPDATLGPVLLHNVILVARELKDSMSDLVAARLIVPQLTRVGPKQAALDLADSLILILPVNQHQHRSWRLSIAWAIYADVSLRLHNPLAALRFLTFSLVSLCEPPLHVGSFAELLRMCARVTRELGAHPLAKGFIEAERNFLAPYPHLESRRRQLDQVELSLRIADWDKSQGPDPLSAIAREAVALLEAGPPGGEIAPLYSVLVNAARLLRFSGETVPADIAGAVTTWLEKIPESYRNQLRPMAEEEVSIELLHELANPSIRSSADWSQALTPAIVAARAALPRAAAQGDAELFWTACLILCQPGLGMRAVERAKADGHSDPIAGTKWLARQIEQGSTQPLDAVLVQRRLGAGGESPVSTNLFDVSLADFCALLAANEIVVLLVSDDTNHVYRCELSRAGARSPVRLSADQWDSGRFLAWGKEHPAKYGHDLEIYFGYLRQPPPAAVKGTLVGLRPLANIRATHVTVIAEARQFGFTHKLAADIEGGIGHVAVCPSPRWLAHNRKSSVPAASLHSAWLGSPKTKNEVLRLLRDSLVPLLRQQGISLLETDLLPLFRDQELVILGSHGEARQGEGFARLSDDEHVYEPDAVAASVNGTTCVVLFACHAGRGDQRLYSHETTGLVSSLLRQGIRVVIAPLWPLDVVVAVTWLDAFGKTAKDLPLLERVDLAQRDLAARSNFASAFGEHPLIRNSFSLFGDGSIKLTH